MSNPFVMLPSHDAAYRLALEQLREFSPKLTGSAVTGRLDEWSDIDLEIICDIQMQSQTVCRVTDALCSMPEVFAFFPADHLGLGNLLVSCFYVDGSIVKVDVMVGQPAMGHLYCRGPWNVDELLNRGCGWFWYTYSKLRRGELLEAAEGLDLLRGGAVLPLWQEALRHSREGFRHAEQRLPADLVQQFWQSRPQNDQPAELLRCLQLLFQLMTSALKHSEHSQFRGLSILAKHLYGSQ